VASTKPAKDLTLTGLYNVLQALREGRALNPKEKQIHSAGQVGVLKTLHDELDNAVLVACGWADLALPRTRGTTSDPDSAKDELLLRLVSLNQRRRAEEANGLVRWLRPLLQNPQSKSELPAQVQQALEVDSGSSSHTCAHHPSLARHPARAGQSRSAGAQPQPVSADSGTSRGLL
jgi:hypothetical protein